MTRIVQAFDLIDGPAAMLEHVDLSEGFDRLRRAQLEFVLGDHEGALRDVRSVCEQFSDRRGMELEQVLARTGLAAPG